MATTALESLAAACYPCGRLDQLCFGAKERDKNNKVKTLFFFADYFKDVAVLGQLTGGMLYPQESESRELKDLNGIWTFKASTSPQSRKATLSQWPAVARQ